jgi:glyoxylase-like metal-dependent hydrolase (beta-lactamase superfamily II)/rhodanese-related sulfurtransferase
MIIEQIYTGCLAQGAYYIESNGEVAIIDPLREVQSYIDKADQAGAKIKYIFETHFHADFVSGHLTLAEKTGADIVYGPKANPKFECITAEDSQVFEIGNITITAMHTPGHTLESTTYLLKDESGKDHAIFSGDTLFLGDVGRPDLAQKAASMTQEELAGMLYESLRGKIMPLADDVIVYPAHGAGSACGKNMMKETVDTLGNQKRVNYALRPDMSKDEFIKEVTDGLMPPPAYFPLNVKMNKEGYESIDTVLQQGTKALSAKEFDLIANELGALVLDVRSKKDFVEGHIPRSIFIGLDGSFAPWVGDLIKDVHTPLLLVVDEERVEEAVTRLSRVGFDKTMGFLKGGIKAWLQDGFEVDTVDQISAEELESLDDPFIVDVRKEAEYQSQGLQVSENMPLRNINNHIQELPREGTFYIHCASGFRSVIASSILKSRGIHNFKDVKGGLLALKETNLKIQENVCTAGQK